MTGCVWPSALVAAVFAVHPLRAESVAWVTERKDVLSGLFFVLTLWAYVRYVRHRFSLLRYLAVMVLFGLGLLAKPMLVTLPFVLLLLDYWPLMRFRGRESRGREEGEKGERGREGDERTAARSGISPSPPLPLSPLVKAPVSGKGPTVGAGDRAGYRRHLVFYRRRGRCARRRVFRIVAGGKRTHLVLSLSGHVFFYPAALAAQYPPAGPDLPPWKSPARSWF